MTLNIITCSKYFLKLFISSFCSIFVILLVKGAKMRLQKYIIISCIIILILSLIGIFVTEQNNKFYDHSTGVFTGVMLTGMTSIILFLYEKNKIINKLYNNFAEIYFTLSVIDKNLGNFLIKKEITDMNFRINYKLTMEIINTIKEFDFDEYTSFFDSKFNSLLEQFLSFNLKLYNLHNIVGERSQGILYHELTLKDLEMKRLQGITEQMLLPYEQQVINDREALLILIGKLHEYVASLKLELTSNLTKLDNYHKFKISWDGRKSLLEKQVQELS